MTKTRIDTSKSGFEYVGIKLTDEQYQDLVTLNALILANEHRKDIPVFNTMLVLKFLGLLPSEMICDNGDNNTYNDTNDNISQSLQRKFGKCIE